jgi:radical SAM superfamily enzyme YgiQ (UPF0313 family)
MDSVEVSSVELNVRKGEDAFVPAGSYKRLTSQLRLRADEWSETPSVVLSCHDPKTRLLPFVLYDRFIFPSGARTIAGALRQAGFDRTRAVFQLWNPCFRPSQARLDGRVPQLLLVSSMQLNVRMAYAAIRDAWLLGEERPLILAGGPKAFHEPCHYWTQGARVGGAAPDAVITGEAYVLLDLLQVLSAYRGRGESLRVAFERARKARALDAVPGLVYLDPDATREEPVLIDTGLQRLVQHLDELPDEDISLQLLEPPHRRAGLAAAPIAADRLRWHLSVLSLQITQGCKFNCSYCPIPTLNQKTWRFRSPEGLARQIKQVREKYGIKFYFGTDDNFFNRRETAEEILEALAGTKIHGRRLQGRVGWGTEATQFDTYKNRDLLPVARKAGLRAIWFGIEDLTAELINKGQKPEVTSELFPILHEHRILPMAMMMYHEGQPFRTKESLYGLANQVEFLRRAGAASLQCTVHVPLVGTREFENSYDSGRVMERIGGRPITEADLDGNHVLMAGERPPWVRQLALLGGYFSFYNPLNLLRALSHRGTPLWKERAALQAVGFLATIRTGLALLPYLVRLVLQKPSFHTRAPAASAVPVQLAPGAFPRNPAPKTATRPNLRHHQGNPGNSALTILQGPHVPKVRQVQSESCDRHSPCD